MSVLRERPTAMVARVEAEAAHWLGATAAADVRRAVATALAYRDPLLENDHDPKLLHPARTVLILLSDAGCRDAAVLCAAAFVESVDADLRVSAAAARGDPDAWRLAGRVPRMREGEDDLLERIVVGPDEVALLAVAEALDHARHLHLRPDTSWPAYHAAVRECYEPAARRFSPPLARRFDRWAEAFGRRLLRTARPGH